MGLTVGTRKPQRTTSTSFCREHPKMLCRSLACADEVIWFSQEGTVLFAP